MQYTTKEEILGRIKEFMSENGEDPFEYQSEAAPIMQVFVSWAFGKGYVTSECFERFLASIDDLEFFQLFGKLEEGETAEENGGIIFSDEYGYDYLAEFIASSPYYTNRFNTEFEV